MTTLDISEESDGVLVEFIDGKMTVSSVEKKTIGFLWEKDVYTEYETHLVNLMMNNTQNFDSTLATEKVQHQVAWDDPGLPNATYPPDLVGDINGDGSVETTGDRLEIKKIVRGTQLASYTLDDNIITNVQLQTSNTTYDFGYGPKGPPVFVRGLVDGKAVLSYDVTSDALDPTLDRLDMMILAEHEAPTDSLNPVASAGPGVPGGLPYNNPSHKVGPDATDPGGSNDELVILNRGIITGSGMNVGFKNKVRDAGGTPFDLAADLMALEDDYVSHYSSGPWAADNFRMAGHPAVSETQVQAVLVANQVDFREHMLNHEGVIVPEHSTEENPTYWSDYTWDYAFNSFSWPTLATANEINALGLRMRNAGLPSYSRDYLTGIYSSLGKGTLTVAGSRKYNYDWQGMDASELGAMGLPISVVLCSWQRL